MDSGTTLRVQYLFMTFIFLTSSRASHSRAVMHARQRKDTSRLWSLGDHWNNVGVKDLSRLSERNMSSTDIEKLEDRSC